MASRETKVDEKNVFRQRSDFSSIFVLFVQIRSSPSFFPISPSFSSSSSFLDFEAFKPWKRTNFPTFPGRIGGTSPRKKNNKREASERSRNTDYGGSVKGKSTPIDIFFDKTGSDELFNVVIATVSRLRIVARLCAILRT